jgi:DNA-binding GntR family transcriptional regulator
LTAAQPKSRKLTTGPTLGDQAYEAIRAAITSGELVAGERTTERALALRLGVSATPVREALKRLEHERLIRRQGSARGIEIAKPSQRELYELALVEAALRGVAARLAADAATDKELNEIESVLVDVEALIAKGEPAVRREKVLRLTSHFHTLIDRAAHNVLLEGMIATATAFDWDFRLRAMLAADQAALEAKAKRHDEHRLIFEALRERNGPLAEERMRRHLSSVTEGFLTVNEQA